MYRSRQNRKHLYGFSWPSFLTTIEASLWLGLCLLGFPLPLNHTTTHSSFSQNWSLRLTPVASAIQVWQSEGFPFAQIFQPLRVELTAHSLCTLVSAFPLSCLLEFWRETSSLRLQRFCKSLAYWFIDSLLQVPHSDSDFQGLLLISLARISGEKLTHW